LIYGILNGIDVKNREYDELMKEMEEQWNWY
jgi:hypothetical protein